MKKNKVLLVTDGEGRYGHAIEKENVRIGNKYIEVRFLDDYENVHTTNWSSFLIYYEVLDDVSERD
jgi:hypothetical protein